MRIYLTPNTVGRYGGSLKGNLKFLLRFIQTELDRSTFKTSFDELWLTIVYPPIYILPEIIEMENNFRKYYETLPCTRLDRRFKKIDVTLQAPQFSEHLDMENQSESHFKFEIEDSYKNISEPELGIILIDKFLEAGKIINSKLKKEDFFDFQIFKLILNGAKLKINTEFLKLLNLIQEEEVNNEIIKAAVELREKRKFENKPKDKIIKDLRVYYSGLPIKALYPYDYQYSAIFLNLLAIERLECPTYHHLYIRVAKTMNEALKQSFSFEDWYVNGLSVIDFDKYQQLSESDKDKAVFNTIVEGLKDIATIDKLDFSKIEKVINQIAEKGLDTELIFKTVENNQYTLTISYLSRSIEEECPLFFNLTNKITNQSKKIQIGKANILQIPFWLYRVILTNKIIKIKSNDSIRGQVWLKEKPKSMQFKINELMNPV